MTQSSPNKREDTPMPDIFLSHASTDQERIRQIATRLIDLGYDVWWDEQIGPGERFEQVILKALETTKAVVVVWTDASIASEWVYEEAEYGKRKNILIPIFLDECQPPLGFRVREGARLLAKNAEKEWENFLKSLESLAGPPPYHAQGLHRATGISRFEMPELQRTYTVEVPAASEWKKPFHSPSANPPRGTDIRCDVAISLEEAFHGTRIVVQLSLPSGEKSIECNIPRGVTGETKIRISGQGGAPPKDGKPGDLYLFISIAPHPIFEREGDNLNARISVPVTTAMIGGHVQAPSPDGEVIVPIPKGTQTGRCFVVRSKGMPRLRAEGRGDLTVEAFVETPTNLSSKAEELVKRLAKELKV
jgi:hypothetical protein